MTRLRWPQRHATTGRVDAPANGAGHRSRHQVSSHSACSEVLAQEPEGAGSITAGRAEAWKKDYEGIVARHRGAIRAQIDKLGWSFAIHRTDRAATELLLACEFQT